LDLAATIAPLLKMTENSMASNLGAGAVYQTVFDRLALGLHDKSATKAARSTNFIWTKRA
jgi:hypothetical protein